MPIYEYRCTNCHRKVSLFWRSISSVDESKARCTYCGSDKLSRLASRVRVIRGGGSTEAGAGAGAGTDDGGDMDDRMMSELGGLDENDPRSLGRFMRKMASESGEELGPEFDEIVGRLEKGEDPEKIEQSMGDVLGDPGGEMGGMMDDDMPMAPPSPEPEESTAGKPADKQDAKTTAKPVTRRPVRAKKSAAKASGRGSKSSSKAKK
jgi:putative FmdB family regulatory protein